MNEYQARYFLLAQAAMVRVEGMKAENQHRLSCGDSITYGEDAFNIQAVEIERCAHEIIQQ